MSLLTANKPVLNITNLSKTYGKKQVLAPTDLTIYDGECVVLCGGNGAGKSTLIKLITGYNKNNYYKNKIIKFNKKNKKQNT